MIKAFMKYIRKLKTRTVMAMVIVLLISAMAVGATVAYLTDTTDAVRNTFSVGNVAISLTEPDGEMYQMIPGTDQTKSPRVTVEAGSEPCWLFVVASESEAPDFRDYMSYEIDMTQDADGSQWTKLTGEGIPANVYYRKAPAYREASHDYQVIAGDKVHVKSNVTMASMSELTELPSLTFSAYAIQSAGIDSAADAWNEIMASMTE